MENEIRRKALIKQAHECLDRVEKCIERMRELGQKKASKKAA